MICTKCNEQVKPVVAIDIDGTLANYHYHFLKFADSYIGHGAIWDYRGDKHFKEWFCLTYDIEPDVWHDIKLAYRQGGMKRSMPVYSHASFLCSKVRELGAELWITTTRPYIRHDNVDPDTREWIRRNNIKYDYLTYDGDKYGKLANLVGSERVCAVLEDLPEQLDRALILFGAEAPIKRKTIWNEAVVWNPEASDLMDATIMIERRIESWKERYG